MSKQLNIILDGNYLFYKSLHVMNSYSNKNKKFLSDIEEVNMLIRKVATDFVSVLKRFSGYHKVIFTKDNHSWRKEFYPDYKNNRSKDSNIDWNNMFNAMDEFLEIIEKRGVIISSQQSAEGDDLMYLWANKFFENKTANTIIVTGDGDLNQIVNFNNDVFTIVFNNNSKLRKFITKNGFSEWTKNKISQKIDIFSSDIDEIFNSPAIDIVTNSMLNIDIDEIDPAYVSLYKAICGDDGDNIPSVYTWASEKNKIKRITKSHLDKLYTQIISRFDEVRMSDLINNHALRNFTRVQLQTIANVKLPIEEWEENLTRNINLSYLNIETIPKYIQDEFNKNSSNIDEYNTETFDRIDLLEGTKFAKNFVVSRVFSSLDKISN